MMFHLSSYIGARRALLALVVSTSNVYVLAEGDTNAEIDAHNGAPDLDREPKPMPPEAQNQRVID